MGAPGRAVSQADLPPKSLLLVKQAGASLVIAMCYRDSDVAFVLLFWLYLFFSLPRL